MQRIQIMLRLLCLFLFSACLAATGNCAPAKTAPQPAASRFLLAREGKAQAPIVVSTTAGESSRASAATLARFLQKITGAAFTIETGDGARGIAVGTASEFPQLAKAIRLPSSQEEHPPTAQQRYRLRSHARGVQLIGASELAVEYAVWDFLHRLGFRQYFPGEAWEIVPRLPAAAIAVDILEEPDYYDRRISTITVDEDIAEWTMRNRLSWHDGPPAFKFRPEIPQKFMRSWINTSHAYSYIVRDHKEKFDRYPEWLALVDGKRGNSTFFCISNPELRANRYEILCGWRAVSINLILALYVHSKTRPRISATKGSVTLHYGSTPVVTLPLENRKMWM